MAPLKVFFTVLARPSRPPPPPSDPIKGCPGRASPHSILLASSLALEHTTTASLQPLPPYSVARPPGRRLSSDERPIKFPVFHSPSPSLGHWPTTPRSSRRPRSNELLRSAMEDGQWWTRVPLVNDPWTKLMKLSIQK
jgi:hypothetical protein